MGFECDRRTVTPVTSRPNFAATPDPDTPSADTRCGRPGHIRPPISRRKTTDPPRLETRHDEAPNRGERGERKEVRRVPREASHPVGDGQVDPGKLREQSRNMGEAMFAIYFNNRMNPACS